MPNEELIMTHEDFAFQSRDGLRLYAQEWPPECTDAVVCLVHGLGEHSGRYAHVAERLNQSGYSVLTFDLRGHGKSGGQRDYTPSFEAFMDDIDLLLGEAERRHPSLPCFLYGHSLGGILVLTYTLRRHPKLAGVVATSSGLRTALEKQKGKVALAKILGSIMPRQSLSSGLDANKISCDMEVVKKYINDPLVHDKMTFGLGKALIDAIPWTFAHAPEFPVPLLLVHGTADQIAYSLGSQEFAGLVQGDCTLKLWDGLCHETHNQPEKDQVLEYMIGWLESHKETVNQPVGSGQR
jgi:alpha-beta hydrolase superfamily lysophospholipase